MSEYELLGPSRCHGWDRLDVVSHVIAGWQEMQGGLLSVIESEPSVDARRIGPRSSQSTAQATRLRD